MLDTGDGSRPQVTYNLEKVKDLKPSKESVEEGGRMETYRDVGQFWSGEGRGLVKEP